MWGHMNVARIPAAYPQYFAAPRAATSGMSTAANMSTSCAPTGPMLLGYNDADVNRAADEQRAQGDIFNGPSASGWSSSLS